ncbi:hypothetical protein LWI29_037087 [Acer saccharum]|uniref:Uncharacterized protein n=1 Tax=Acer saccharum TaxID=4024 RepID=A0AA39TAE8_ACESA|nr:hypothetical protein LWI29_037087 [Acer saccharum]
MVQIGKLVLEKRQGSDLAGAVRDAETSSSSEEDHGGKQFLESCRERGECSKRVDLIGVVVSNGPELSSKPKNVSFRLSSEGPYGLKASEEIEAAIEDGVSLDSLASFEELVRESFEVENQFQPGNVGETGLNKEVEEVVSSDNQATKNDLVKATIEAKVNANATVADSEEELTLNRRKDFVSVMQGSRFRKSNQVKVDSSRGKTIKNSNSQ